MAIITQPYIRDASPESYQVRPESLEAFEPSYASSKVKKGKRCHPESGRFVPRRFVPKVEMIRTQR